MMDEKTYNKRLKQAQASQQRSLEKRKNRMVSMQTKQNIMDPNYNLKEGVVKLNTGNTLKHEMAKAKLTYLLMKQGHKVYTEVIFKSKKGIGKRADIYLPERMEAYEILYSETIEKFQEKVKGYPSSIDVTPLKAEEVLKNDFVL